MGFKFRFLISKSVLQFIEYAYHALEQDDPKSAHSAEKQLTFCRKTTKSAEKQWRPPIKDE